MSEDMAKAVAYNSKLPFLRVLKQLKLISGATYIHFFFSVP